MKLIKKVEIGDVKILKREVSNMRVVLEKGDKVVVTDIGERGYDIKYLGSEYGVSECGWDIFED